MMTDYLITHDTIAFFLIPGTFWLITGSVVGLVYLTRFSPFWFCCLLSAISFSATLPYSFAIKAEQDRRHTIHVEQEEISLNEYRRLYAWIATVPYPPDLTEILADGRVSRAEYRQLHTQLDSASLDFIKQQLAQHTTKGGEL